MQARICDECKKVIEEEFLKNEPLDITEGNFKLIIDVRENLELCPACIKKGRYQVARKAFESLKNKRWPWPEQAPSEEDEPNQKKGKTKAA